MTFTPGIQILFGAHSATGAGANCCMDWDRTRAWIYGSTDFSNINFLTGAEVNFGPIPVNANTKPMGLDANGNLYLSLSGLHSGGEVQIDGNTLSTLNSTQWANGIFGGGDIANVPTGGQQFMLDTGPGGGLAELSCINVASNTINLANISWAWGPGSIVCQGPNGANYGYMVNGTTSNEMKIFQIEVSPTPTQTVIGSYIPTDFDASWTSFNFMGVCIDQSDGNPIISLNRSGGGGNPAYIAKFDGTLGTLLWSTPLPSAPNINENWKWNSIKSSRLYVMTPSVFGSPPVELNTINTDTGAIVSTSVGLAGVNPVFGPQVSSDTLGTVALQCGYSQSAGGPPPLNSTPTSFGQNWALLYVAAPIIETNTNYGGSTRSIVGNAQFSMALTQELNAVNPCGDESPDTIQYITAFDSAKRWMAGRL